MSLVFSYVEHFSLEEKNTGGTVFATFTLEFTIDDMRSQEVTLSASSPPPPLLCLYSWELEFLQDSPVS